MSGGLRWTDDEYAAYIAKRTVPGPATTRRPNQYPVRLKEPDRFLELLLHAKLPMPAREVIFIPGRDFLADYLWLAPRVIVEKQGHKDHTSKKGVRRDYTKLNMAQAQGWRVFQFTPKQLRDVATIEFLRPFLESPA